MAEKIATRHIIRAKDVHDKIMETANNLLNYSRIIQWDLTNVPSSSSDNSKTGGWRDSFYVDTPKVENSKQHLLNLIDPLSSTYNVSAQLDWHNYESATDNINKSSSLIDDVKTAKYLIRSFADITNLRLTKIRTIKATYADFKNMTDMQKIDNIESAYEWMFPSDDVIWKDSNQYTRDKFQYNWKGHFSSDEHKENGTDVIPGGRYLYKMGTDGKYADYMTAYENKTSLTCYNNNGKITESPLTIKSIHSIFPDSKSTTPDKICDFRWENNTKGHLIKAQQILDLIKTLNAINGYIIKNLECHYGFIPYFGNPPGTDPHDPPPDPDEPWYPWRKVTIRYNPQDEVYSDKDPGAPDRWKGSYYKKNTDPEFKEFKQIVYSRHKIKAPENLGWKINNSFCIFLGWTRKPKSKTVEYNPGEQLAVLDKNITLYPIYKLKELTLNLLSSCFAYSEWTNMLGWYYKSEFIKFSGVTFPSNPPMSWLNSKNYSLGYNQANPSESKYVTKMTIPLPDFDPESKVILTITFGLNISNKTQDFRADIQISGEEDPGGDITEGKWHRIINYKGSEGSAWGGYNKTGTSVSLDNKTVAWSGVKTYASGKDNRKYGDLRDSLEPEDGQIWHKVVGWKGDIRATVTNERTVVISYRVMFSSNDSANPGYPVAHQWTTFVHKVKGL